MSFKTLLTFYGNRFNLGVTKLVILIRINYAYQSNIYRTVKYIKDRSLKNVKTVWIENCGYSPVYTYLMQLVSIDFWYLLASDVEDERNKWQLTKFVISIQRLWGNSFEMSSELKKKTQRAQTIKNIIYYAYEKKVQRERKIHFCRERTENHYRFY